MRFSTICAASLLAHSVAGAPVKNLELVCKDDVECIDHGLPRLVIYCQTTHDDDGNPISMLPLVTNMHIALTHLIVAAFHINEGGIIHLNDFPPHLPMFYTLWNETKILQEAGVKVMGMVGGAAPGSFTRTTLDGNRTAFDHYYGQLRGVIRLYELDGLDIDVEQSMSQAGINRLITNLRDDFGPEFIITLSPVVRALFGGFNLSGFNYMVLEKQMGKDIAFYNTQFYNGHGIMNRTYHFDRIVNFGWDPQKIVIGQLTSRANGFGATSLVDLNTTVVALRERYGRTSIGGIMGWEYFNSEPFGTEEPWRWAQIITAILRPWGRFDLRVSINVALALADAWIESAEDRRRYYWEKLDPVKADGSKNKSPLSLLMPPQVEPNLTPNVDYMAMVNVED